MDPQYTPGPAAPQIRPNNGHNPYEFIMNPEPKRRPNPLGGGSLLTRIVIVGVLLVVVLFGFMLIKNLLSGSSNLDAMVVVAQRQQEIVRLTTTALQQQEISSANQSLVITTKVSVASAQAELQAYLVSQGRTVKPKELALKQSLATDEQLKAAQAATTYNTVLPQVLRTQLDLYEQELQRAYTKTEGKNGRSLLSKQFDGAELLGQKLDQVAPAN